VSSEVPLREKAYRHIRQELLVAGPRAFGGRLVEQQLALELNMSRTPVRDALRRLAVVGLVEEVGGGFVPRRLRVRDVREQYELRMLLESKAVELAASRPLDETHGALDSAQADEASKTDGSQFHLAMAEASGNSVLARSIETINERSFLLRLGGMVSDEDRRNLRAGHCAVLIALRAGDPTAAAKAMREHLGFARDLAVAGARHLGREGGALGREDGGHE
jgi:DNA-binding GntR family transcriptional regulator